MQFSVIYSVDCPEVESIDRYAPPDLKPWDQTESDDQHAYAYLEGCWENGTHRKWCAILDREQFDAFVEHCNLFAERCMTMGSLGASGFGFGWAPAISFTSHDPDAIQSAYVTPLSEVERESFDEQDWERVRGAVLSVYG